MSVAELQKFAFTSKYSRWVESKKRRETWDEAVTRVRQMMLDKYPSIHKDINWAYDLVQEKRVLGSQRALQFGGVPALRHNARMYNCTSSYCDRLRFFQECFYLLLCGCGTGFSVLQHHVEQLPKFTQSRMAWKKKEKKLFQIPDTIEGWSDAAGILIASYFEGPLYHEYKDAEVVFDFSQIRPKGSPLSSGVGRAPGPEPLMVALENIRTLLDRCVYDKQEKLRPIDCYDIVMFESEAVLSGGVRRSACLTMFSLGDMEMTQAKIGNWKYKNPQRARSNNSVLLLRDEVSEEEFLSLIKFVRECGEPGFIWGNHRDALFNPCVEAGFWAKLRAMANSPILSAYDGPIYKNGDGTVDVSGWQMCNLTTQNGKLAVDEKTFLENCEAEAIIGTCQAGFTDFPYLGRITEEIVKRESLLGCSITGIMDSPKILLDPVILRKGAAKLLETNARIAPHCGVGLAARIGNIKPEGNSSATLGTSSGADAHHSELYLRNVQVNKTEIPAVYFQQVNPIAVEESRWSSNKTDNIISFCVEAPKGAMLKKHLTSIQMLDVVKLLYENWIVPSKRLDVCTQPWLSHNVSNTIQVADKDWDEVARYIYKNRYCFAGVSLISAYGDKDYIQAPFTAVYTPAEIASKYGDGSIFASGIIENALDKFEDLWQASDAVLGQWYDKAGKLKEPTPYQQEWVARAKRFAERYFAGNVKNMTYCLKDVYNWKKWLDLKREYRPVDYTLMVEEQDNCRPTEESACAGGSCLIGI